jgi:hypothetical protein
MIHEKLSHDGPVREGEQLRVLRCYTPPSQYSVAQGHEKHKETTRLHLWVNFLPAQHGNMHATWLMEEHDPPLSPPGGQVRLAGVVPCALVLPDKSAPLLS